MRTGVRLAIVVLYLVAGYFHLAAPGSFLKIMPHWVPWPEAVVMWTGIAELAGALAFGQWFSLPLRRLAAWALALYALCVWPANVNHMLLDLAREDGGWGMAYHVPRMVAQPLLIWATLWAARVIEWPFGRRH